MFPNELTVTGVVDLEAGTKTNPHTWQAKSTFKVNNCCAFVQIFQTLLKQPGLNGNGPYNWTMA